MQKMAGELPTQKVRTAEVPSSLSTVAIYARVSTGSDAQLHSLDTQLPLLEEEAARRGCTNPRRYIDVQTGKDQDRPDYQRLMADCRAGLLTEVIATEVSRLQRNRQGLAELIEFFKLDHNPNLVTIRPSIDLTTPHGRVYASVIGEFAVLCKSAKRISKFRHSLISSRAIFLKPADRGKFVNRHPRGGQICFRLSCFDKLV